MLLAAGGVGWVAVGGFHTGLEMVVAFSVTTGITLLLTSLVRRRARIAEGRRIGQLDVIQQAARRLSSSLTREEVGQAVVEETSRVIAYHNARVYLLEPPDQLVCVAFDGRVNTYEHVDRELLRTRLGEGFTGWGALHRTPVLVPDAKADPRGMQIPGTPVVDESMLVVPMLHDDILVGAITLSKLGLGEFHEDDLRLLMILADQAGTAFMSTSHLAESERLASELRRLLEMSSALSRTLDPRAVADLMAEHLARAVGAERAQISDWDVSGDRMRTLGCHPATARDVLSDYYDLAGFPLTRTVLVDRSIAILDADDPDADPAEVHLLREEGTRGLLMLPLVAKDAAIGLVELTFKGRATEDVARITLARTMAHEAAMALENARLYETARNLADRDPLTGFYNHRYLHERLSEEVVRAVRTRRPLSVVMLDLDDFKLVNDTFGHIFGDQVLVHVANLVRGTLRGSDVAARYGGDEFALILPETDREDAMRVAERIIEALSTTPYVAEGRTPVVIAASVGVSTHPEDGRTATDLIAMADAGLYKAKGVGGGRALAAMREEAPRPDPAQGAAEGSRARPTMAEVFDTGLGRRPSG